MLRGTVGKCYLCSGTGPWINKPPGALSLLFPVRGAERENTAGVKIDPEGRQELGRMMEGQETWAKQEIPLPPIVISCPSLGSCASLLRTEKINPPSKVISFLHSDPSL